MLTSWDKPKAALVSIEDYEHLNREHTSADLGSWQAWLAQTNALVAEILARRGGTAISVDDLLHQTREELEARGDWITSGYSTRSICRGCGGWANEAPLALRFVRPNLPPET